jgi:hypothetical protein
VSEGVLGERAVGQEHGLDGIEGRSGATGLGGADNAEKRGSRCDEAHVGLEDED